MSNKGDDSSNARMTSEKGNVQVFEEHHKAFSADKSSIQDNKERLFLYVRD